MVYAFDVSRRVVFDGDSDDVVLLSPSLYWYMSCNIPTKNMTKAKNIAKHMMSERPTRFSSIVLYKRDGSYDAYAYDKNFVKHLLKELNLKNPKVYFANQLGLSQEMAIDDEYMLYSFAGRIMQKKRQNRDVLVELKSCYKELLSGQKPVADFLRSDRNVVKMLMAFVALFGLYVGLYGLSKVMELSNIQRAASELDSGVSYYEMESLIKRYSLQERQSQKLKSELQKALNESNISSLVYEDGKIEVKDEK